MPPRIFEIQIRRVVPPPAAASASSTALTKPTNASASTATIETTIAKTTTISTTTKTTTTKTTTTPTYPTMTLTARQEATVRQLFAQGMWELLPVARRSLVQHYWWLTATTTFGGLFALLLAYAYYDHAGDDGDGGGGAGALPLPLPLLPLPLLGPVLRMVVVAAVVAVCVVSVVMAVVDRWWVQAQLRHHVEHALRTDLRDVATHFNRHLRLLRLPGGRSHNQNPNRDHDHQNQNQNHDQEPPPEEGFWVALVEDEDEAGVGVEERVVGCVGLQLVGMDDGLLTDADEGVDVGQHKQKQGNTATTRTTTSSPPPPPPPSLRTGELRRMVVDVGYRGHGIAGLLLDALVEHARHHHLHTVQLSTGQPTASRLYQRYGFRLVDRTRLPMMTIDRFQLSLSQSPASPLSPSTKPTMPPV